MHSTLVTSVNKMLKHTEDHYGDLKYIDSSTKQTINLLDFIENSNSKILSNYTWLRLIIVLNIFIIN